ncbi:MAG: 1,6-anhydro-N-acetylmuramyl-L-alanine amidase AmpD [Gammaproteobacteria bacterium]|nr:MAG: 1,6-anhydro-N-acetylmuramyl-L-alanine amidase AmpD [Gammaproteobacteria bacterium]
MDVQLTEGGWVLPARRCLSPFFNSRPTGAEISLLVIHNISLPPGQFGTGDVRRLFTGTLDCDACPEYADLRGLHVSAHLLIDREGALTQFVPFSLRAWHAGKSCFEGRPNCNDFSVGIELEGTDTLAYTDAQYQALSAVARALLRRYPRLSPERMVGHSDIAPGRKTDPGPAFDWQRFRAELRETA